MSQKCDVLAAIHAVITDTVTLKTLRVVATGIYRVYCQGKNKDLIIPL